MNPIPNSIFFEEVVRCLSQGKEVKLRVKGISMRPLLRNEKDEVVLFSAVNTELRVGQIVLFRYRGKYLLHRIIGKKKEYFVIQGDGVHRNKEMATRQNIVGVVHTIIRQGGRPISVQSRQLRFYWWIWRILYPIRAYLLRVIIERNRK